MESDKHKIINALGGKRGLLDSGLPSLVFLIAYNIGHGLKDATIAAVITSALLTLIRLIRRDTLQHVLSGFVGVAFCALLARKTGHAVDFYLPGLIINVVYGAAYAIFNLIGLPILGLVLGPILGENLSWRKVPERKRAYTRAGIRSIAPAISTLSGQPDLSWAIHSLSWQHGDRGSCCAQCQALSRSKYEVSTATRRMGISNRARNNRFISWRGKRNRIDLLSHMGERLSGLIFPGSCADHANPPRLVDCKDQDRD
jgi:hypothetical protein